MKKNIMIVFGLDDKRRDYLKKLYNQNSSKDDNVYITIDLLNHAIGLDFNREKVFDVFNNLIKNGGVSPYLLKQEDKSHSLMVFYCYMSYISKGSKRDDYTLTQLEMNKFSSMISVNAIYYMLNSWSMFLKRNFYMISHHDTFIRREENRNKYGSGKFYDDYKASFLAKNAGFEYICQRHEQDENTKKGMVVDNRDRETWNRLKNNSLTLGVFKNYIKSDEKGIKKILNIEKKIQGTKDNTSEDFSHMDMINTAFLKSYWRKISKLAIDWIEEEAKKEDSPIKGLRFYMENNNCLEKHDVKSNIDERKFHSNWRHCDYSDIASKDHCSPITYSELRYARKLMNRDPKHHIELDCIEDKSIFNRIKKFFD
ncbi:hypothetical protein [Xenorhabdus cabanillasii]|uniref:Uncharacterized protein n=1 Tax=Xenorhabdus cabanillasii JM26 TaxID=1427517 RepID=W1J9V9_9GAMM|nr:hypothetical protein [Xenorhabdus cabanillasii]PHM76379.1 hypothetical protein Xcab_03131 [Xenorhabdus cabanillasii JM26]CDL87484.1 hypothetical protein XCR1_920034 [Xenorhabdus cabanillasii JM26]